MGIYMNISHALSTVSNTISNKFSVIIQLELPSSHNLNLNCFCYVILLKYINCFLEYTCTVFVLLRKINMTWFRDSIF